MKTLKRNKCFLLQSCNNQNNMIWAENSHTAQWNRIESPEINPHVYGQLIFDQGAKHITMEKEKPLQ